MIPGDVACVVLASGSSLRFGEVDKLEANLVGQSVLDHALDTVFTVGFGEIFIVTQGKPRANCATVQNDRPEKGQGYALRLGLRAAKSARWKNVCVVLGDMPLVNVSHLENVIEKMAEKQSVISEFEGQGMPPAGFHSDAIDLILSENSMDAGRSFFDRLDFISVAITAEAALDVDTPEDLSRVSRIMKAHVK